MIDKNGVLKYVDQLEAALKSADTPQVSIIKSMLKEMEEIPQKSRIEIIKEAQKAVPSEEKIAGKTSTRYQYLGRMKSIVTAHFLTKNFNVEVGGVNKIFEAAKAALDKEGINFVGEKVEDMRHLRELKQRKAQEAIVEYKVTQEMPGLKGDELAKHVQEVISTQQATEMLDKLLEKAESQAVKLCRDNGKERALEYARKLLESVSAWTPAAQEADRVAA